MINKDFSYDYYLIQFENKELLDKFYDLQPFNETIIFHKLSHLRFFPCIRSKTYSDNCMMCENHRNPSCLYELCKDCCSVQSIKTNPIIRETALKCNCSIEIKNSYASKKSALA